MKETKELKTNKGITLIALVITIIVMMLLVGVTISMAINGGLFTKAGEATGKMNNALKAEELLADGGVKINNTYYSSINEYLDSISELEPSAPEVCPCCDGTGTLPQVVDEESGDEGGYLACSECSYVMTYYSSPEDAESAYATVRQCENEECLEEFVWNHDDDESARNCPECGSEATNLYDLVTLSFPCGHSFEEGEGLAGSFVYEEEDCPYCEDGYINE